MDLSTQNTLRNSEWGFAALLYFLSWGWMIFLQDPLWDDWILLNSSSAELLSEPDPRMPVYALMGLLPNPVLGYHLATFFCYFGAGILFVQILQRIQHFPRGYEFPALLLFWLLPLNIARIACINFPYALSLLLFLAGFRLWIHPTKGVHKIWAPLLFIFSFMTPSFLVLFYAVAGVLVFQNSSNLARFRKEAAYTLFLCSVPIIAWLIRANYFQPQGVYAEYYALSLEKIGAAPWLSLKVLVKNFLEGVSFFIHPYISGFTLLLLGALFTLTHIGVLPKILPQSGSDKLSWKGIGVGFFLLLAGVFPYVAIGKEPGFSDWLSRHQLLMSPGLSILIISLRSLMSARWFRGMLLLALSGSLSLNFFFAWEWKNDTTRREEIAAQISQASIPDSVCTVLLHFPEENGLARNRHLRFYEITGIMHQKNPLSKMAYFPKPPGIPENMEAYRNSRYFMEGYHAELCDSFDLEIH
jgi:hypothetical protein